jgi:hypothetical protein
VDTERYLSSVCSDVTCSPRVMNKEFFFGLPLHPSQALTIIIKYYSLRVPLSYFITRAIQEVKRFFGTHGGGEMCLQGFGWEARR